MSQTAPIVAPSAPQATDDSNFGGPNAAQMAATAAATNMKPTTAVEPTVVTGDNITNTVIPQLNSQAAAVSQKGTTVGTDGKMYYSDGSLVPAPVDSEYDPTTQTYKDASGTYGAAPQFVDNPTNDPEIAKTNEILGSLKNSLDSSTLSQVNAIESQYKILQQSASEANASQDNALAAANVRGGTTRYAPLDAMSTALATTNNGLARIQKLDADEDAAIATVKTAQQNGDYQLMSKALDTVDSIRTSKQTVANDLATKLSAANDAAAVQKQQVQQDNAVGSVLGQGTTDPAAILKVVNDAGYNMTAAQVAASIKNLTPTAAAGSAYKFSNTDVGKLIGAGLTSTQIQAVQDYYNGKGNAQALSGLTAAQQAAVQTALVGKTATASGGSKQLTSGSLKYTASDISEGAQKLQASKGADGYVDPNTYLALAKAWTGGGGSIKDFIKNYPVSSWVNPANTFVTPEINDLIKQDAAGTKTSGASTLESDLNTLPSGRTL